jgi:hypothetical protein
MLRGRRMPWALVHFTDRCCGWYSPLKTEDAGSSSRCRPYALSPLIFLMMGWFTNIGEFSLSSLTHGGYVSVAYANRNATCVFHRLPHLRLPILIV